MAIIKKPAVKRPVKKVKKDATKSKKKDKELVDVNEKEVGSKTTDDVIEGSSDVSIKKRKVKVRHGPVLLKKDPSVLHPLISATKAAVEEEESGNKGKERTLLSLRELAASIEKSSKDAVKPVVKELTKLAKRKSLKVPLRKTEADQISRVANYEDVKNLTTKKWQDVVTIHKTADHLSFPLPVSQSLADDTPDPAPKINLKTEMETKIEALLSSSENRLQDSKPLTEAEEKLLKSLSVEDAKERVKELQRTRALLSYQEAKLKRQAKIKSKSFHRVRKREKLRTALKDFESLKQSDPQAALKQLEDMDRTRALERASLRHRNTGRFAKQAKIRAKYNDEARAGLEEQMLIHQKNVKRREYSSDEEDAMQDAEPESESVAAGSQSEEGRQMERNREVSGKDPSNDPTHDQADMDDDEDGLVFDVADSYNPWLKPTTRHSLQNEAEREGVSDPASTTNGPVNHVADKEVPQIRLRKSFLQNPNDNVIDADPEEAASRGEKDTLVLRKRNQLEVISEAFAEDDVVQEFAKEREDEAKLKDEEDSELPGWGSWTGVGADTLNKSETRNRKRRQKEEYKASLNKKLKVKDAKNFDPKVIIKSDGGASGHRVKHLPFPFHSVPEFEAGILANPIGRTFVPETAFRVLTREKVSTKLGTIIPPMSQENVRTRKTKGKQRGDKKTAEKNGNPEDKK